MGTRTFLELCGEYAKTHNVRVIAVFPSTATDYIINYAVDLWAGISAKRTIGLHPSGRKQLTLNSGSTAAVTFVLKEPVYFCRVTSAPCFCTTCINTNGINLEQCETSVKFIDGEVTAIPE